MKKTARLAEMTERMGVVEQPLSERERALVEEARQLFTVFEPGCRPMHERARLCRAIAQLEDPEMQAKDKGETDTLQLQTLRSTLVNCVADQMDNMPEAVLSPERPDTARAAEDLTDVVRYVLDQNDYEALHRARVEDLFVAGTAVMQISWDEALEHGRGNVAMVRWPIEAIYWDPQAERLQDGRAVFKASFHPRSWYAQHYPEQARYIADVVGEAEESIPDVQQPLMGADEARVLLLEYWYRRYDARTRTYAVHVAYVAGGALLYASESARPQGVYRHGLYPFVVDVYTRVEGAPIGNGMIWEFKDMQRYINRYAKYMDESARMASKARMLVRRDAQIDNDQLCNWETNVIEGGVVDESAIRWLQGRALPAVIHTMMLQMQDDIKQDSGQNQFTRGEGGAGVTAASAISALQEAGGKTARLRTAVLNAGFRQMITQILWLVAEFYDAARTVMVTGRTEDGQARAVCVAALGLREEGEMLPEPPYTVRVQVQRRNPMRVQAQNEEILQFANICTQAGMQIPPLALLELLQMDGKDRLLPVMQAVAAEQDQTRQMAGKMQQMDRENIDLKQMMQAQKCTLLSQGKMVQATCRENQPQGLFFE